MQPETFGEKVARLRKEKQMTQANLAAIMHVTDKAVSKWECDVAYPEITSLPLLAESLGTTADALLSKTEMVKRPFQPRKLLGIFLSALIMLLSAFEILVTRINHESWMYDCIQLLVLGGVVWSFQKRDWTESGMDFAYKIFIIFVGITLCVWMLLDGAGDIMYVIPGVSLAMFGVRLLCLPASKMNRQKPESGDN